MKGPRVAHVLWSVMPCLLQPATGLALKWSTLCVPLGLDVSGPLFGAFSSLSCEDFPSVGSRLRQTKKINN